MERKQAMARRGGAALALVFGCALSLFSQAERRECRWTDDSGEQEEIVAAARSAAAEPGEIEARLLFDPVSRCLIGVARLRFDPGSGARSFALDDSIALASVMATEGPIPVFRRDHRIFLAAGGPQEILVCFSGRLPAWDVQAKQLAGRPVASSVRDLFLVLQTDCLAFMPGSTLRFSRSRIEVHVPARFQCLGTGARRELPAAPGTRAFEFAGGPSRGFMLVCGDFLRLRRLEGELPVNFFGSPQLDPGCLSRALETGKAAGFFLHRFGRLDVPELNILLCRAGFEGGVSSAGCIVCFFNPDDSGENLPALEGLRRESPVFLHDPRCDCLVHEIAHQWWGGVCSWNRRADCWITEGLAQFSTLLYLRARLKDKEFLPILERQSAWVERYAGAGRVTENARLALIRRDPICAQAVIYNRSTLILWMLREMLGEAEMDTRLRRLLDRKRGIGWGTEEFAGELAGNDPILPGFFGSWVGRADLPLIRCRVRKEKEGIRVRIEQDNGPFVFPLRIVCRSVKGIQDCPLTVSRESEEFTFQLAAAPLAVSIDKNYVPAHIVLEEE